MAELAALLTPAAVIEQLPARVPIAGVTNTSTAAPGSQTRAKPARSTKCATNEPTKEAESAPARLSSAENIEVSATEDDATSQQRDEVTLAAARSARLYRSWMFENLMAGFTAAFDQAADMVGKKSGSEQSSEPAAPRAGVDVPKPKARRVPPHEAAEDYRAKMLQLTNANINANLDYARKLAAVRSPAEFVELSTDRVCAQVKLCAKHAVALARLSRSFTAMGLPKS